MRHSKVWSLRRTSLLGAAASLLLIALLPGVASASEGLKLVPELEVLLGLIVVFIAFVYPLNALLFKPIFAVLDERSERIEGARRRAEQLEREADEVIGRYRSAVSEVRQEAELARREQLDATRSEQSTITSGARGQAERQIAEARSEISSALDAARESLRSQVEDLARQAAERIVGRELS